MTEKQLYEFIWRADTREKIAKAEEWLKKNVKDNDLFDDLMTQLTIQYDYVEKTESGESPVWAD